MYREVPDSEKCPYNSYLIVSWIVCWTFFRSINNLLVLNAGNFREWSIITSNVIIPATPSNPQQPIHSLRLAPVYEKGLSHAGKPGVEASSPLESLEKVAKVVTNGRMVSEELAARCLRYERCSRKWSGWWLGEFWENCPQIIAIVFGEWTEWTMMKLYEIDPVMNLRKGLSALDPKAAGLPLGFLLFLWTAQAHQKAQNFLAPRLLWGNPDRDGVCAS